MLSTLNDFIFPKICLYCNEKMYQRHIFCESCVNGIDLIYPKGRCFTCFKVGSKKGYLCCKKIPSPWVFAGALFEKGSHAEVLLSDIEKYAKEIAAFFVVQFVRLKWPIPDAIYTDKEFKIVAKEFCKLLNIPKAKRFRDYAGEKVLILAKEAEKTVMPENLLGARVFHLSYLIDD
jgi:hypothetical protein